jgi:DNA-binding NarL/FixJ family response regulator
MPKLVILDAAFQVTSSEAGALELLVTMCGSAPSRDNRLPHAIESAIRSAAGVLERSQIMVIMPLPQLVLRITRLEGLNSQSLAVTVERTATHEPLRAATARFKLSTRELDILAILLRGGTARDIAGTLQISTNTVKEHVKRIYVKMSVNNRAEAVAQLFDFSE